MVFLVSNGRIRALNSTQSGCLCKRRKSTNKRKGVSPSAAQKLVSLQQELLEFFSLSFICVVVIVYKDCVVQERGSLLC